MEIEESDSIEIKAFCMRMTCPYYRKEMKYEIEKRPSALVISSSCLGCGQKTEIRVKL